MTPEVATSDRVGPYQLVKAIGAGGSARIDLARIDRAYGFQRHVVIKRPLEHLRGDERAAMSLRREARIGARLRHPNLVAVLDAGVHDNYDYLVLEYIHGGSLRTLMQTDAPQRVRDVPANVAIALAGDVARGLHDAHELADETGAPLGLVHRDVSPGNILVGLDGAVKLADFGIAKETRVQTLSGSMHGTVTYMAPEQCRGHAFDRRADVFSLGVILYELLTGARLFWADNDVASLHRVLSGNVPRPRKLKPSIAPNLEEIVMTAVAHDQDRRFASARDLADALELHATDTGEILGARWIARWVHELIGPRDAPWIHAATVPAMPVAAPEGSLVELIEAVPEAEPPLPTFGPTSPSWPEEIDTKPRRPGPASSNKRAVIAGLIGAAAAAAAITFILMRDRASTPAASTASPAASSSPAASPAPSSPSPTPSASEPSTASRPSAADDSATKAVDEATKASEPTTPLDERRGHRPAKTTKVEAKKAESKTNATIETKPETETKADTKLETPKQGSGSARVTSPTPSTPSKVEWNPTMLLPTDSGSGTKKK